MSTNYLAFSEGFYYQDFLEEQDLKRLEFAYKTRMDFLADVRKYFRHNHAISGLQLQQRQNEVGLIKFLS